MDFDTILRIAGWITGVAGAGIILQRYVLSPLATVIKSLRKHFGKIVDGLPLLAVLLEKWPQLSGPGSLFYWIDEIEYHAHGNSALILAVLNLWDTPIYEFSPEGDCRFANKELCKIFGLSPDAMLGQGWLRGIIPEEREIIYDKWESAIRKSIPYECSYTVNNSKTGKYYRMTTYAIPLIFQGHTHGYLGVFKSVSEVNLVHPRRNILVTKKLNSKIHLHLDCGHVFSIPDSIEGKAFLKRNTNIICTQCDKT